MSVMELQPPTITVPLRRDGAGAIRVGKTRVLLELVIRAFDEGKTPEAIVQAYDTLSLADVYAVIGYYLSNPAPIEEYLRGARTAAEATRRKIEASQPSRSNLREILLTTPRPWSSIVLRLVSDENFKGEILRGMLRRLPGLDIVRVQDVGLSGADDPAILEWAATADRILLTHDRETMPNFVYERVRIGTPMPGVFLVNDAMPTGQAIDELRLAIQCYSEEECKDLVTYFPL